MVQRIAGANYSRHAEFAGDDGGMAGTTAPIGDDGRCALHHRLPVGVGHVGDQHVTGLHTVHVGQAAHHAGYATDDLLADGTAFGNHFATFQQVVALSLIHI